MRIATDLTGRKFGQLTAIKRCGSKDGNALWECACECGNLVFVKSNNLISGNSKSCGCLERKQRIARITTHGLTHTRLYKIWENMKQRCYYPKHEAFSNYGGRGIAICDEWKSDFNAFYKWATLNGYADDLTIDRINPDGNYEPSNCQWLTRSDNTKKAWEDRRRSYAHRQRKAD